MAIARSANLDEWSDLALTLRVVKFGRTNSGSTLDSSLINLLITVNGLEWFQDFLTKDLLNGDDNWTARWLAALLKNQKSWQEANVGAIVFERYQSQATFDVLGPNSVWLVEAWMIQFLSSNETFAKENVQHVIELIENQPQLGKMVVQQIDAEIAGRFYSGSSNKQPLSQAAVQIVEEAIARYSKRVLEDDPSSPEAVARAASRLASTTDIVDEWRPELIEVIRKRLTELADDHQRLTTTLSIEPKHRTPTSDRLSMKGLPIPAFNRFAIEAIRAQVSQRGFQQRFFGERTPAATSLFSQLGLAPPYIESECLALIVLAIRLDAAPELDKELAAIAVTAWPDYESLMNRTGATFSKEPPMYWPDRIEQAGEPWSTISKPTWLGWAIDNTLSHYYRKDKERVPLLQYAILQINLKRGFGERDRNRDGKVSAEEFSDPDFALDTNKDGNLDFEEYTKLFANEIERANAAKADKETATPESAVGNAD